MRVLAMVGLALLGSCGGLSADKEARGTGLTLPSSDGPGTATGTGTGAGTGSGTGSGGTATGSGTGTGTTTGSGTPTGTPPTGFPRSCAEQLALAPSSGTGIYTIEPQAGSGVTFDVWCDMDVDGGGWTLVGSSVQPLSDEATAWHLDLTTVDPTGTTPGVWDGLRQHVLANGGTSDFRVTCTQTLGSAFLVDLSFYDTIWYVEVTQGTDADSCFNENEGLGADPPPARRNNITGVTLPVGDPWNAGYLEGEDSCPDTGDFTVDFDDRGMNSDEGDGTDWGSDDGDDKCGLGWGIGFFLFVRE